MEFEYYGIDWAAMALTVIAIYLLGNKHWIGFVLMIAGNLCWIILGLLSDSVALMIANLVFIGMNVRGIWKWRQEQDNGAPEAAADV
ncbi:MAG: nicotinamide mononucleotide transporter [Halioglobus sp.]|nr:nicotinamide mononucleotide transporter [Halioglobus sp.]